MNSALGVREVGDGDKPGSSAELCARRSPSFPVIQDSVLKGKLGIPEARVNRLMNRSISCTVKNPKVEVFGYPPPSTQAGVAPFNILVGASPPRGLLSSPFPSQIPGEGLLWGRMVCRGVVGPPWGGREPLLGFVPCGGLSPVPCHQHPWVLVGKLGCQPWGPAGFYHPLGAMSLMRLRPQEGVGMSGVPTVAEGVLGADGAAQRSGCVGERG